jgi:hypothetical protein
MGILFNNRLCGKLIKAVLPDVSWFMPMLKKLLDRSLEVAVSPSISGKAFDNPSRKRSSYPYNFLFLLKIGCLATYTSIDIHFQERLDIVIYIYHVKSCLSKFMTGCSRSAIRCVQLLLQVYNGLQLFLQEELFYILKKQIPCQKMVNT